MEMHNKTLTLSQAPGVLASKIAQNWEGDQYPARILHVSLMPWPLKALGMGKARSRKTPAGYRTGGLDLR